MKKGQMMGQVFVYILMLIVFAGILIFGYRAIADLIERGKQIELEKFKIDFKKMVERNMHYGNVEVKEISVPGDYEEICFVDRLYWEGHDLGTGVPLDESGWSDKNGGNPGFSHSIVRDALEGGSRSNVYLYPKTREDDFEAGPLHVLHQYELKDYASATTEKAIYADTEYRTLANQRELNHDDRVQFYNFNCMPIIEGKIQIRLRGLGDSVELLQVPLSEG